MPNEMDYRALTKTIAGALSNIIDIVRYSLATNNKDWRNIIHRIRRRLLKLQGVVGLYRRQQFSTLYHCLES
jgi:hypothetical protein